MSTSSFTGTIKNFSPKPNEDYYGIFVDNGQEEKWLNGHGNPKDEWSKGDKVKIKANMDEFIEIEEIDVISESGDSEAESNREEGSVNSSKGENTSSDSFVSDKVARRQNMATMKAVETVNQKHPDLDQDEWMEKVSEYAVGIFNRSKTLGDNQ